MMPRPIGDSTENHPYVEWVTYPADRSAGSMAYATVFGYYFTSDIL